MKKVASIVAACALAFCITTGASAQNDVMVIEFTQPPNYVLPPERVVVFVGEVACTEARFDDELLPRAIVGTGDQPVGCSAEGAEVTFLKFGAAYGDRDSPIDASELFNRTTFAAGTTLQFVNWAPMPAVDPGPVDPLPAYMRAFVYRDAGLEPPAIGPDISPLMAITFLDPPEARLENLERIVIFVGELPCVSVEIAPKTSPVATVGAVDQPLACRQGGAEVSFLQFLSTGQPLELFIRVPFLAGGSFEVLNWAPQPSETPLPAYMQAFLENEPDTQIGPAASGNARLAGSEGAPPAILFVLATVAVLFGARRFTAGRTH